jgi:hypothetical protein
MWNLSKNAGLYETTRERQRQVFAWALRCFPEFTVRDPRERVRRVIEEALELGQAEGLSIVDARQLVEYVFKRPAGEPQQELGGLMLTTLAYAENAGYNRAYCEEIELKRVLSISPDHFREKFKGKIEAGV